MNDILSRDHGRRRHSVSPFRHSRHRQSPSHIVQQRSPVHHRRVRVSPSSKELRNDDRELFEGRDNVRRRETSKYGKGEKHDRGILDGRSEQPEQWRKRKKDEQDGNDPKRKTRKMSVSHDFENIDIAGME